MRNQYQQWEAFAQTGRVEDYLAYRGAAPDGWAPKPEEVTPDAAIDRRNCPAGPQYR